MTLKKKAKSPPSGVDLDPSPFHITINRKPPPIRTPSSKHIRTNTQANVHLMSRSQEGTAAAGERRYKGVRCRKWGKWVSEIRVPGGRERLWLGSYATPEAAAVAHDTAVFFLRGPDWSDSLNFPDRFAGRAWTGLSPRSVQRVASDSGMAVDAQTVVRVPEAQPQPPTWRAEGGGMGNVSWREVSEFGGDLCVDDLDFYM